MKLNLITTLILLFNYFPIFSQEERISPPRETIANLDDLTVTINYGSPSVKGRTIWGDLVPYNKVWRTGANEATTIEFTKDVTINGTTVKAGKYALFTIPTNTKWTIILNEEYSQWGAYKYNSKKDVLQFEIQPEESNTITEMLTFTTQANQNNIAVTFSWDKLVWKFTVY